MAFGQPCRGVAERVNVHAEKEDIQRLVLYRADRSSDRMDLHLTEFQ
jgi:hypothetical protein